jgi:methylated-DNA-[protein]-cysteine S-methyltransferase
VGTADTPPRDGVALSWTAITSPVGELTVVASEDGVRKVAFGSPESALGQFDGHPLHEATGIAADAGSQLLEYFAGRRCEFGVVVDWSFGEGFRLEVLRTLVAEIPFGTTTTYAGLAERCGRPSAARSVGAVMGSNPVPLLVPCHRVLASGGGMGGFGPGLEAKRRLLVLEGALEPTLLDDLPETRPE